VPICARSDLLHNAKERRDGGTIQPVEHDAAWQCDSAVERGMIIMKLEILHKSLQSICIALGYRLFYENYGQNICTARFLSTGEEEHVHDVPYEDLQTYPATQSRYVSAFNAMLSKLSSDDESGQCDSAVERIW